MPDVVARGQETGVVPTKLALFLTFLKIGVCGFGGVGPWARRIIVEDRRWMDDRGYAEILTVCQVLPGPNVGNVSVVIGDRFHGVLGSTIALVGLMTAPVVAPEYTSAVGGGTVFPPPAPPPPPPPPPPQAAKAAMPAQATTRTALGLMVRGGTSTRR